ncbi:MAG TPA: hypothetical protein VGM86_03700, partial [Thermoanaerobaculia bacterium]|jgi:hypothetical protein
MNEKILLAMIAAAASAIVAFVSLCTSFLTSRNSSRSARSIEELKADLQASSSARQITDTELKDSLQSLKGSMKAIQIVKDEIQLALAASSDNADREECQRRLKVAKDNLFKAYQDNHPNLTRAESVALHKAKNAVADLDRQFGGEEANAALYATRERLSDLQGLLRDSLAARLIERVLSS